MTLQNVMFDLHSIVFFVYDETFMRALLIFLNQHLNGMSYITDHFYAK